MPAPKLSKPIRVRLDVAQLELLSAHAAQLSKAVGVPDIGLSAALRDLLARQVVPIEGAYASGFREGYLDGAADARRALALAIKASGE